MKLTRCEVRNFGSYPHFEIDFSNAGLGLIYGRTGSGKSTIPDMPAWILYGKTAKDGAADDVRSWQTTDTTSGELTVYTSSGPLTVTRIRGKNKNDLFWYESDSFEPKRGKDVPETQKLLEKRLGVSSDVYFAGAYFHEFSSSGHFFLAKAKERRALFEGVADLSFAVSLAEKTTEAKRQTKAAVESLSQGLNLLLATKEDLTGHRFRADLRSKHWGQTHEETLKRLQECQVGWDKDRELRVNQVLQAKGEYESTVESKRKRLTAELHRATAQCAFPDAYYADILSEIDNHIKGLKEDKCPTCQGPVANAELETLLDARQHTALERQEANRGRIEEGRLYTELGRLDINPQHWISLLDRYRSETNPYTEQLASIQTDKNYYLDELKVLDKRIENNEIAIATHQAALLAEEKKLAALAALNDLSQSLRGEILKASIKEIETSTNRVLDTYFDSELRVAFTLEGADSLKVDIAKSGYDCAYKQLSKGQRQLLKLSFAKALMGIVANTAGVHFDNLFFDEALDGLDTSLKLKAFNLFQDLSTQHESIFLIEHNEEFQNLFSKRYKVEMVGDSSQIEVEDGT